MNPIPFSGRLVIIGFGSIGQGTLPLILKHIAVPKEKIHIIAADDLGKKTAEEYGVSFTNQTLTKENYRGVLEPLLSKGDFLLNLSVNVSSVALVELCREHGALYLDTCIEPWPGGYDDPSLTSSQRSNYAIRESALHLRDGGNAGPTAVIAHGANPGLVSHLVKEALLIIARDTGVAVEVPQTREEWSALAEQLGVKVIHIAERDTQAAAEPTRMDEFVNTWSIPGFVSEGGQPAELGWGSHEKELPPKGAQHDFGSKSAIYINQPGYTTQVRSWTPLAGAILGYLITHNEAISIADFFSKKDASGNCTYRPTVHYAYHPCDAAVISLRELAARNGVMHQRSHLLMEEIVPGGIDELGVLLMGHKKGAYWYGSRLTIDEARARAAHNNATSLQVTSAVLGGMIWAIENPERGVVEADEMDHERVLEVCRPYLGEVVGEYSEWTPLDGRRPEDKPLFPEDLDFTDPWQFKNFRVS